MSKIGILALQGDVREHASALADLGAHVVEVRTPDDLAGIDGLVFPGGESTAILVLLASAGLFEPIAERLGDGMPAFGTCAGMILLADEVLDGRPDQRSFAAIDIGVRRNALGRQVDSFEADLDLDLSFLRAKSVPQHGFCTQKASGEGLRFPAVFIRAPVVERVGPAVDVLATLDGRPVLCRQGPVLAAAFHPELSGDLRLHQLFLGGF